MRQSYSSNNLAAPPHKLLSAVHAPSGLPCPHPVLPLTLAFLCTRKHVYPSPVLQVSSEADQWAAQTHTANNLSVLEE